MVSFGYCWSAAACTLLLVSCGTNGRSPVARILLGSQPAASQPASQQASSQPASQPANQIWTDVSICRLLVIANTHCQFPMVALRPHPISSTSLPLLPSLSPRRMSYPLLTPSLEPLACARCKLLSFWNTRDHFGRCGGAAPSCSSNLQSLEGRQVHFFHPLLQF